jgi:hypothetical protein
MSVTQCAKRIVQKTVNRIKRKAGEAVVSNLCRPSLHELPERAALIEDMILPLDPRPDGYAITSRIGSP